MARVCVQHPSQHSANLCGHCGLEFCADCLVHPRGRRKLPLCVPCALVAGGVRSSAGRHTGLSRREIRRRVRERERELAQLARFTPAAAEPVEAPSVSPGEGDIARRIEAALASGESDAERPPTVRREAPPATRREAVPVKRRDAPPEKRSWLDDYFTEGDGGAPQ